MRHWLLIALPILTAGACEGAHPSPPTAPYQAESEPVQPAMPVRTDVPGRCDVLVSFTSVCCGVNQPLQTRITDLVTSDARVASTSSHPWGREGEVDLCVRARSPRVADSLTRDISAAIASGGRGPPVTVRRGGKPQTGYTPPVDLSVEQRLPGT